MTQEPQGPGQGSSPAQQPVTPSDRTEVIPGTAPTTEIPNGSWARPADGYDGGYGRQQQPASYAGQGAPFAAADPNHGASQQGSAATDPSYATAPHGSTATGATYSTQGETHGTPAAPYGAPAASYGTPGASYESAYPGSSTAVLTRPEPKKRSTWWQVPTAAVAAALLASGGTAALMNQDSVSSSGPGTVAASSVASAIGSQTQAPVVQADAANVNWTATAAAVTPSVVSIEVTNQARTSGGEGSGVIVDSNGDIVTNNHVVAEVANPVITVTLSDGRSYSATVVGTDPSTDLAVIKLTNPPSDLKPISWGDSAALKVGDPVMAVGNPLGLSSTVTTGIVSALNRPVTTDQVTADQQSQGGTFGQQQQTSDNTVFTNAVQTSAAINPGNSGGALVNAGGQLIGINSSIASLGSSATSQSGNIGIGFAIPSAEVKSVTSQLIASGKVDHAFMGVASRDGDVTEGSSKRAAAVVATVNPGAPAAAAGLKVGDAIVAIDGKPIGTSDSLVATVREHNAGDKVTVTYVRDGKRAETTITFASRSSASN